MCWVMRKDEMMLVELRCQHSAMDVLGDAKGRDDVGGVKVPAWSDGWMCWVMRKDGGCWWS